MGKECWEWGVPQTGQSRVPALGRKVSLATSGSKATNLFFGALEVEGQRYGGVVAEAWGQEALNLLGLGGAEARRGGMVTGLETPA